MFIALQVVAVSMRWLTEIVNAVADADPKSRAARNACCHVRASTVSESGAAIATPRTSVHEREVVHVGMMVCHRSALMLFTMMLWKPLPRRPFQSSSQTEDSGSIDHVATAPL